jgi:inhibitor of KinA
VTVSDSADIVRISAAGDSALVLEFPPRIDPRINEAATGLADTLWRRWSVVLRDVVIGYCTVTVYFDPLRVDAPWLEGEMRSAFVQTTESSSEAGAPIDVPVCYDGDLAPDLDDVAAFARCSTEEVIARHGDRTYRVYMVGFIPGFAYLAEVDGTIAAPRRKTPRTEVPAGSVAIAGGQTGIYPAATPGGWNIVGRTPVKPYDPDRERPLLFHVGDHVRFRRITRQEFERAG